MFFIMWNYFFANKHFTTISCRYIYFFIVPNSHSNEALFTQHGITIDIANFDFKRQVFLVREFE